ncbi:AsmA-like C-terminal region-containing protein [Methylobacterium sp. NEAU 140]|uniref:AsmA family protein n=1 Tax=Methylobacterium sp. NEAU 140 TaxID=3064945 RepID=UPI00273757CB|nr:AsmA family protein [Methylobacterium sp. NEAU 140]MDP4025816.1 AsmA-like C-terminal region-containing protein [Methylobacterium sp. NEAU 140]
MRLRALLIGLVGLLALAAVGVALAWPLLAGHARDRIEARLARETGLRWRIGRLELDASPGLVLADVTVMGDGLSGRLARARATGSAGLLLGGAGTVQVRVEAASLTVPMTLPAARPGEAAPAGSGGPALTALRAIVRGADAAPTGDGRTLALAAAEAEFDLDIAPGPSGGEPSIRVALPERGAVLDLEAAPGGAARPLALTLAPAGGPRIAATATVRRDGADLRLDRIAGTIDRAPFSGTLAAAAAGGRPSLALDLRLDALALTEAGAEAPADPGAGLTVPVRTDLVPDPAWLAGFDGQARVAVQRLALGPVQATAVALTARVRDGRLDAALDTAALYGGSARGRYVLEPEGRTGRHQIGLSLSGVRVLPLLRDVAGVSGLDGTGTARLDVQARGLTPRDLVRSAAGQAEIAAVDGRIDGLDLARAAGLTGVGGSLATRLDRLGGRFTLGEGRATTRDLTLKTGLIEAEGAGTLDLVARTLDLRFKPIRVTAGGRLNVPIQVSGPWDGPSVTADVAGLAEDPMGALEGLRNLGETLMRGTPGGDPGEGLGGFLDALIPRQDRPPARRRP